MNTYTVTVKVQFPAWNEKDGIVFVVKAESKAKAIKEARSLNRTGGQVHREQGRAVWTATEAAPGTTTTEEDEARWRREDDEARRGGW